jgi:hypothetical protein
VRGGAAEGSADPFCATKMSRKKEKKKCGEMLQTLFAAAAVCCCSAGSTTSIGVVDSLNKN